MLNQRQRLSRLFSTARAQRAAKGNVKPRRRRSLLLILLAQQHNLAETLSRRASSRLAERVASLRARGGGAQCRCSEHKVGNTSAPACGECVFNEVRYGSGCVYWHFPTHGPDPRLSCRRCISHPTLFLPDDRTDDRDAVVAYLLMSKLSQRSLAASISRAR